jgi:hypothetical protein
MKIFVRFAVFLFYILMYLCGGYLLMNIQYKCYEATVLVFNSDPFLYEYDTE